MTSSKPGRSPRRGFSSAALLWLVVALAAAHGFLGANSPVRAARLLADGMAASGQGAGTPSGDRSGAANPQRLVAIADWRGLALKSFLAGSDTGPAILPAMQWQVTASLHTGLLDRIPESFRGTATTVLRARAPPLAA
ncbi:MULTISPECIES: hypothetical protein [unclassified Mesorhizobium]|uniref:hypothetical protein n=1 Tax=unclassified Mesorhizobium TaxID=325217 RepID=UPI003014B556